VPAPRSKAFPGASLQMPTLPAPPRSDHLRHAPAQPLRCSTSAWLMTAQPQSDSLALPCPSSSTLLGLTSLCRMCWLQGPGAWWGGVQLKSNHAGRGTVTLPGFAGQSACSVQRLQHPSYIPATSQLHPSYLPATSSLACGCAPEQPPAGRPRACAAAMAADACCTAPCGLRRACCRPRCLHHCCWAR